MIQKTFRRLFVLQKGLKHRLSMVSTIREITRQYGQAKTEDVLNYQHKENVVLKAGRILFGQMILVAEIRSVNMEDVLSRPLGPLQGALANADGSLRKKNKAALARELEKNVSPAEAIPIQSTCIIDGMGMAQKLNGNNKTFAQVA